MRILSITTAIIIAAATSVIAADYNYISPERVKKNLETNIEMLIVDIQEEPDYKKQHIQGALATYAYPVKSDSDRAKLDAAVSAQKQTNKPVVIVCPRGKGGAKRSYDYLKSHGITEDKLAILEKGMAGWPFPHLAVPN